MRDEVGIAQQLDELRSDEIIISPGHVDPTEDAAAHPSPPTPANSSMIIPPNVGTCGKVANGRRMPAPVFHLGREFATGNGSPASRIGPFSDGREDTRVVLTQGWLDA